MTPERKEEIRAFILTLDPECELAIWLNGLLAALEEAQQQAELAYAAYEGLQGFCVSRGEYDSLLNKHSVLARAHREAQQTIASQRESWEELKSIVSTNATGGRGEDINDYDIMLNIIGDLEGEKTDEGHDNA